MSQFSPTGGSSQLTGSVNVGGATGHAIANISMVAADTEYSFVLPATTRAFVLKLRNLDGKAAVLRIYETSGGVPYLTVNPGGLYSRTDMLLASSLSIYIQSNLAGRVAELEYWY